MVECKIMSSVVCQIACQQTLDDVDRFRETLLTLAPAWPTDADDVLVQAFSGTKPKSESVVAEQADRSSALSYDRGVVAHGRTGHRSHQAQPACRVGQCPEDRPRKRRVTLLLEPGKEVIGNGREVEARLLGSLSVANQLGWAVLFGHEFVAELEH